MSKRDIPNAVCEEKLTVKLYPYKVSELVIRVFQEDAMVTICFEVEGDVSS